MRRTASVLLTAAVVALCGGFTVAEDARQDGLPVVTGAGATTPTAGILGAGPRARRGGLPDGERPATPPTEDRGVAASIRISAATMAGAVDAFALSPDGTRAVYIADQVAVGRFELYSTPLDGSAAPVKISAGLTFGTGDNGVSAFEISPDGSRVAFLADPTSGGGADDLYSAPIDGSTNAVRLNPTAVTPVDAFGITPDGATVLFFGPDSVAGSGATELYARGIAGGGAARQLSDAGAGNAAGEVMLALPSPDGARVVYSAVAAPDGVAQWYVVATSAAGPGTDVQLSDALAAVGPAAISPDGATVVYVADDESIATLEVFAVPIDGGARLKLNAAMAGAGATRVAISADGTRVGYLADQDTAGVVEVYGARIDQAGSGVRISTPMSGTQLADTLNLGPDSATVVYQADQETPGTFELFRAPIDGSASPTMLHDLTAPANVGFFSGLGTPIIASRAVYPVVGDTVDVYSVPFDGSEPFARLNDAVPVGDAILNAFLPTRATRLLAWGEGEEGGIITERVYVGAVRDDLPLEQVNGTAAANALGVFGYEIPATEDRIVYLQDELTTGKIELFSRALDSDGDGVTSPADNCPFVANPGQGSILFDQTVRASDPATFVWDERTDVRWVRGPLAAVATLTIDLSGVVADAASITDDSSPLGSGAGFFYLFAVDCDGRSYQTGPGAEPGRDGADLP